MKTRKAAAGDATELGHLKGNPKNPRKPFTEDQLKTFRESLVRFGDLGGIVRNITTDQLIGGHKRVEAFKSAKVVKVVSQKQPIDPQGTVAVGHVLVDGNRFGYREVKWSPSEEIAANLAANRWGAEWDWKLVSEALRSIDDGEMRTLTGFSDHELANLLAADWTKPDKGDLMGADEDAHIVKLTAEQHALLLDAKAKLDPTAAISDAGAIEMLCRRLLKVRH